MLRISPPLENEILLSFPPSHVREQELSLERKDIFSSSVPRRSRSTLFRDKLERGEEEKKGGPFSLFLDGGWRSRFALLEKTSPEWRY